MNKETQQEVLKVLNTLLDKAIFISGEPNVNMGSMTFGSGGFEENVIKVDVIKELIVQYTHAD